MREVVVSQERRLVFQNTAEPEPKQNEVVIAVKAISLNRGEVRRSRTVDAPGYRPGWDLAGIVERAAADGSGPEAGSRVVAITQFHGNPGAWAERVALPTRSVAELPEEVSFAQAACLPVAGLTALLALDKRGSLLGRSVLITGATGGVGHLATQLARLAGAQVVAAVRNENQADYARRFGAHRVALVGDDPLHASGFGPYDLILDSVGGDSAGAAMTMLATDGVCVLFGASAGATVSFELQKFYFTGGARVYGLVVFDELARGESATKGFKRLVPLVASGQLKPDISLEAPWTEIDRVADQLIERRFTGKAVLHL